MVYLIDPQAAQNPKCLPVFCRPLCFTLCSTYCGIKPLYGIDI